jgi:SAM-dependent methyltransferase
VGVDLSSDVIAIARELQAQSGETNVTFNEGDVYDLVFGDSTFDVVYAHQVLQHLSEPVKALQEMRRVLKIGGTLAVRDSDYGAFSWSPDDPRLDRWMEIYQRLTKRNHALANAGRYLPAWVRRAGFDDMDVTSSTWTFHTQEERAWWGNLWADRVRHSEFARQSIEEGLSSESELDDIADAFTEWANDVDGLFIVSHTEVLARR